MTERSQIRSLTIALYGSWQPKRLFLQMASIELVAYADESGTHDGSGLTVMAGWVGYAESWAKFDPKWNLLLHRNGLRFVRSKELRQGTGQFKNKRRWPVERRLELAKIASQLAQDHSLFSLSVLLRDRDYDEHYIGADRALRRHRAAIDSKYGVCARAFMSVLSELVERYGGTDSQVTLILEARHRNSGAPQRILIDMYDVAPDRARFISPIIGYAIKDLSPGVQAADVLAYPVFVSERDGKAEILDFESGFPDALPYDEITNFRVPIAAETLKDIKAGQIAMGGLRRRLGRHWIQLDGFPKGWRAEPLRSIDGYVLKPPQLSSMPQLAGEERPGNPEPVHYVHLRCA